MGFLDKLRTFWRGDSMGATAEEISARDAEAAMNAAATYETPGEANNRANYERAVIRFVQKWNGKDAPNQTFGPQSPALITEFMQEFQPGWRWDFGNAVDLKDHPEKLPGFFTVPVGRKLRFGDIVVFAADHLRPWGNVGIVTRTVPGSSNVAVFTQHPTAGAVDTEESGDVVAIFRRNHAYTI